MLVIGSNTTEAHPVLALRIKKAVRNGATLVVADPRKIWLTKLAKRHLQLRPGTDVWLLNAIMHVILEEGLRPDVVLGDMDSASDAALHSGAELIVHAYSDGRAPGRERLERLGLDHLVAPAVGTSQDVAMLLAYENGAALIVSVGAHFNLVEFLDKNRAGMSSTFLTRLRIGETLVDAKGVSRLYNPGVSGRMLALFLAASLAVIVVVVLSTPALENLFELLWLKLRLLLGL